MRVASHRLARVRVDVEPGPVRRRDVNPDPMADVEQVARRRQGDRHRHGNTGLEKYLPVKAFPIATADHGVVDQHVIAGGIVLVGRVHVQDLRREIRVERARGDPQVDGHRARDLYRLGERLGLEDEHVRPLRQARVGLLGAEDRGGLDLICGARGEQVPQPEYRAEESCPGLFHPCTVCGKLADGAVKAADRRDRMSRVEGERARRRGGGRLGGRERTVAVEVVRRVDASRERPLPLVAPAPAVVELARRGLVAGASAHDEDTHGCLGSGLARRVVGQEAVEELELLVEVALHAPRTVLAEVHVKAERCVSTHPDMAPGTDDEACRCGVLRRHGHEVLGIGCRKRVIPAGRKSHRDVGMLPPVPRVVVLDPIPVRVVGAARVVVQQGILERRHVPQGRLTALPRGRPEELPQVAKIVPDILLLLRFVRDLPRILRVDEERPEHVLLHRTALAALVLEAVRGNDIRPDRRQVWRALECGAHLGDRSVRAPDGSDPPVRPGLSCDPLTDVVSVAAGVGGGGVVVDARRLRAVAVTEVDQHDVVSLRDEGVRDLAVALVRLVVRSVEHDRGEAALDEGPVARRPVDVERETDVVAHRHHDVLRQDDPVLCAHSASPPIINFPPQRR